MKNNLIAAFFILVLFGSCSSSKKTSSINPSYSRSQAKMLDENSFKLTLISEDDTYGYTEQNPIKVGGVKNSSGPLNERRFLNALLGPGRQELTYYRQGSCCPFKSRNGLMGSGLLDRYEVKYDGLDKPIIIFINMYDFGELKAPKGFTFKQ
jgi:hypothetical protein